MEEMKRRESKDEPKVSHTVYFDAVSDVARPPKTQKPSSCFPYTSSPISPRLRRITMNRRKAKQAKL
jgi:hypothetical protein